MESTTDNNNDKQFLSGQKLAGKYMFAEKIGSGAFGDIYIGLLINNNGVNNNGKVAVKVEHKKSAHPQLEYEAKVYRYLAGTRKIYYFPFF